MSTTEETTTPKGTTTASTASAVPAFRLDNERLCFRFTATLSDRHGAPVERLPDAGRLDAWLHVNNLHLDGGGATDQDLIAAHRLREAVHRAGTAIVEGSEMPVHDLATINAAARDHVTRPELTADGLRWVTAEGHAVPASLGLIARDAIIVLGGPDRDRVKACQAPTCRGLYVDTSQARNRRWCSMAMCGNRAKKARFRHHGG